MRLTERICLQNSESDGQVDKSNLVWNGAGGSSWRRWHLWHQPRRQGLSQALAIVAEAEEITVALGLHGEVLAWKRNGDEPFQWNWGPDSALYAIDRAGK